MRARWLGLVTLTATLAGLAACGPGSTPGGDAAPTDAAGSDGADSAIPSDSAGDVAPTDGTSTDGAGDARTDARDAGPSLCGAAGLVDLNAAGTRVGGRTTYDGNNAAAPDTMVGRPPADCTQGTVVREVAHRYHTTTDAYLHVSTANTATAALDTVLWAQNECSPSTTTTSYGCNDDVSQGTLQSAIDTDLIPAGSDVFVLVGLFWAGGTNPVPAGGAYEITIDEIAPIGTGMACDPSAADHCAAGNTCVGTGTTGTCTANGAAGTHCRDATDPAGACDTGLLCRPSTASGDYCVAPLAPGAECDLSQPVDACPAGQGCAGPFQLGHCTALGTAALAPCRDQTDPAGRCDAGLECVVGSNPPDRCFTSAALGSPCNFLSSQCAMGTACLPSDPANRLEGVCVANGALGGLCNSSNPCMTGLTCSNPNGGTCQAAAAAGTTCDFAGYSYACATGTTCAPTTTGTGGFACATNGTAAGSACATSTPQCTAPLQCSQAMPAFCENVVATGGACNPRFHQSACTSPEVCMATAYATGTCAAASAEGTANNDGPTMAEPARTLPVAITGSLGANDLDCYTVTVPTGGGSIYAETNDGAAGCFADEDTRLFLIDAAGRTIDFNDDSYLAGFCSAIDGTRPGSPAHDLAAGNYTVCVIAYDPTMPIARYELDLAVSAPTTP